jgi:hypothetical protein
MLPLKNTIAQTKDAVEKLRLTSGLLVTRPHAETSRRSS